MEVQDLTVLINLADRCRKNGAISFDEFSIVEKAIKSAVAEVERLNKQSQEKAAKKETKKES